ncbi:MAG: MarR family transcriptional regulator [Deltaproteobacteria bacterium]|nr:MAG: MarR family transcriptional regulator [Deltaproteobacteria bacterium]
MNDLDAEAVGPVVGLSFLLSQLGHHAGQTFGERLAPMGLVPQHVGVLRMLAMQSSPGFTQRTLATRLGVLPSRMVALLDQLEARNLVRRETDPRDRRRNRLRLTEDGREAFVAVEAVTARLDADLFASLSSDERTRLEQILRRMVGELGLGAGVHPAYRQERD